MKRSKLENYVCPAAPLPCRNGDCGNDATYPDGLCDRCHEAYECKWQWNHRTQITTAIVRHGRTGASVQLNYHGDNYQDR
jgi:hypothetical protein